MGGYSATVGLQLEYQGEWIDVARCGRLSLELRTPRQMYGPAALVIRADDSITRRAIFIVECHDTTVEFTDLN